MNSLACVCFPRSHVNSLCARVRACTRVCRSERVRPWLPPPAPVCEQPPSMCVFLPACAHAGRDCKRARLCSRVCIMIVYVCVCVRACACVREPACAGAYWSATREDALELSLSLSLSLSVRERVP